jgi:hypothetical protein
MKTINLTILAVAGLFLLTSMGCNVMAQEKAKAPAQPAASKTMIITVVGKIVNNESMGGYYIQGTKPPEVYRIVNQNPKVLEQYAKSGQEVTIEAHSAMGDNLVIDKIEGKPYAGSEGK